MPAPEETTSTAAELRSWTAGGYRDFSTAKGERQHVVGRDMSAGFRTKHKYSAHGDRVGNPAEPRDGGIRDRKRPMEHEYERRVHPHGESAATIQAAPSARNPAGRDGYNVDVTTV